MKKLLLYTILLFASLICFSQDFDNTYQINSEYTTLLSCKNRKQAVKISNRFTKCEVPFMRRYFELNGFFIEIEDDDIYEKINIIKWCIPFRFRKNIIKIETVTTNQNIVL